MIIDFFPHASRSGGERRQRILDLDPTHRATEDFLQYGRDYFDNPAYPVGYGQYTYDGRYHEAAQRICGHYGLQPGATVLEAGCAKGFLLVEFHKLGMQVTGIDASAHAVEHAHPLIRESVRKGDMANLPFPDASFDLVLGKEVLPHVPEANIESAIRECMRVARGPIFFEIQCGRTPEELTHMKQWDQTHQTLRTPEQWEALLQKMGYRGDVHYKVLVPAA